MIANQHRNQYQINFKATFPPSLISLSFPLLAFLPTRILQLSSAHFNAFLINAFTGKNMSIPVHRQRHVTNLPSTCHKLAIGMSQTCHRHVNIQQHAIDMSQTCHRYVNNLLSTCQQRVRLFHSTLVSIIS